MQTEENKFSMFGGVFTPSILTIFGVIMFMRAGYVVGHAGIINALIILVVAKSITTLTTFSISAIATNMKVKGGGAYYLISRTLGPEFGGTIGLTLFLAQTLSIPLYILGFTEALLTANPSLEIYRMAILVILTVLVFLVTIRGAEGAIKIQFLILAILGSAILLFMSGLVKDFSMQTFVENLKPYDGEYYGEKSFTFWQLFAIYFPAVTGIMAGVNMSGDLKNPSRDIPRGTFWAIGVGALVYGIQIVLMGGVERGYLIDAPYDVLLKSALFGAGFVVSLGVYAATVSSAIGSFVGAPRILSALAIDKILRPFDFFAKTGEDGEPRRAVLLSFLISLMVVIWAAQGGSSNAALNVVAGLVSMFFLWAYGIINIAAFVESFGANPSFRPRFKLFHWWLALLGAAGCIAAAFLINAATAVGAIVVIVALFYYVRLTVLESSFGDARRGFYYSRVRQNLITLEGMPDHAKNWRPTILLFPEDDSIHAPMMAHFADWFGGGRGIVLMGCVVKGDYNSAAKLHKKVSKAILKFSNEVGVNLFPSVAVAPDLDTSFMVLMQTAGVASIRPNLLYVHIPDTDDFAEQKALIMRMRHAHELNMGIMLSAIPEGWEAPARTDDKRIDIWWRGKANGSLMAILAWLLRGNSDWAGSTIRLLRLVEDDQEKKEAHEEMEQLVADARMEAIVYPIIDHVSDFPVILKRESKHASCVFMGLALDHIKEETFFDRTRQLIDGLPPIFFIASAGSDDLLA